MATISGDLRREIKLLTSQLLSEINQELPVDMDADAIEKIKELVTEYVLAAALLAREEERTGMIRRRYGTYDDRD